MRLQVVVAALRRRVERETTDGVSPPPWLAQTLADFENELNDVHTQIGASRESSVAAANVSRRTSRSPGRAARYHRFSARQK
jgi:hypothetical protein